MLSSLDLRRVIGRVASYPCLPSMGSKRPEKAPAPCGERVQVAGGVALSRHGRTQTVGNDLRCLANQPRFGRVRWHDHADGRVLPFQPPGGPATLRAQLPKAAEA
jgi:hypothetical protein